MNVRKPANYNTMYREVAEILTQNLPQMEEIHAIGKAVSRRPEKGAAVAAAEFLQAKFPDCTGFSPRNVRRMRDFYRTYENDEPLLWLAMKIGWTLNVVIMEAELTRDARHWYLRKANAGGLSKAELLEMIESAAHLEKSLDAAPDTCYTDKKRKDSAQTFPYLDYIICPHNVNVWNPYSSTQHRGACTACGTYLYGSHYAQVGGMGTCLVCGYYGNMPGLTSTGHETE